MKIQAKHIAIAAGAALPLFLLAPGHASRKHKAPFTGFNYAHRGLHTQDKSVPENSLAAFRLAAQAGYGVELDVHLSRDGEVIVFHDDTLDRVCGLEGRPEDFSFQELQAFPLCGTEERIPLLSQVLAVMSGRGPIILELKTGKNKFELCRKTYDILKGYPGPLCIESFDPFIVAWFRFKAPELLRGQLAAPQDNYTQQSPALAFMLSNCLFNFMARPQFIAYQIGPRPFPVRLTELMGAMKVGWTSRQPGDEKGRDAVIFEFYKPGAKFK